MTQLCIHIYLFFNDSFLIGYAPQYSQKHYFQLPRHVLTLAAHILNSQDMEAT